MGGDAIDEEPQDSYIVSCDIVGHSRLNDHRVQQARISGLNAVVQETLSKPALGAAVWASGGDGGHVLLTDQDLAEAIDLAARLKSWAAQDEVPLRVTCHLGPVSFLTGADGRQQPVGQGINQAGAFLAVAGASGITVSEAFRRCVEQSGARARFHEPRRVVGKHDEVLHLVLMSLPGLEAQWPAPREPGVTPPEEAQDAWDTLYQAKRVLQVNNADQRVNLTLRRLRPDDFWYESSARGVSEHVINPFFGYLDARALREVVRVGQLVERSYNEVICHQGDEGNSMFVILRGQVGVFQTERDGMTQSREPDFVLGQGEIVGELAFALNRRRTAELVTLSDTSLLAFSFEEFMAGVATTPGHSQIQARVDQFITARVLEHVANSVDFLVGHDQSGPLGRSEEPWESLLEDILFDCRVLTYTDPDRSISLDALQHQFPKTAGEGLFLLVSGELRSQSDPNKVLRDEDSPLVYANLPGAILPDHVYTLARSPVKLLHLGPSGLDTLPFAARSQMLAELQREIARRYFYDVFISYNFGDEGTAEAWKQQLTREGLNVFVDKLEPGAHFTSKIQASLLDSLVMLAFISPHTMTKAKESNWVLKEIAFREANFRPPWIVPVGLRGSDIDAMSMPYTMIDVRSQEDDGVAQAVRIVRAIRSGAAEPPLLVNRELKGTLGFR